jgi:hypothetical protein
MEGQPMWVEREPASSDLRFIEDQINQINTQA